MSAPVRRAGRHRLPDGVDLIWTVADGRRGRRWRVLARRGRALRASVLLEVDLDGRPARLEVATPEGLLTLHPEPTGELHGNAVTAAGVDHLALAWSHEHELEIEGLPLGEWVAGRRLSGSVRVGEERSIPVVAIGRDLGVKGAVRRFERVAPTTWRIAGAGRQRTVSIDQRGLPLAGDGEGEWPLEVHAQT